ncbi:probable cytokinin riboside 5'-monophosphate phosphoribohydrolase LOG4 isoform X7 [Nematostella vectensis]|uniref:probable cytokinin riboside 5'-monophosphate phosphoribohydrolase LOG4 isoform X7 n=1 Tax=Nematostella vectensis TaxID=45351 RepID=UPI00207794CC|nr:probable cytokinin riboside 5'-monophosphate phosphoribohydrolase LOG4 isoform X7 [Nematostella vectensis]
MPLQAVTVFCGSSLGNKPQYEEAARALGKSLAEKGIELIYGGGPSLLESIGKTVIVQDMHTRKQNMLEKADALIALPGGYGTAEELMEMITWRQLKLHNKPIGVVNTCDYYKGIIDWVSHAKHSGFIGAHDNNFANNGSLFMVSEDCDDLLQRLAEESDKILQS